VPDRLPSRLAVCTGTLWHVSGGVAPQFGLVWKVVQTNARECETNERVARLPRLPVSRSRGSCADRFPWPVCRFSLLRCLTVPVMPYSLFFFPCLQVFFLSSCKSSIQGIPLASFGFFMHYGMPPLGNRGAAELVPWLAEDLGPWAGAMTSLRRASDPE